MKEKRQWSIAKLKNDEDILTYSLSSAEPNVVLFKLTAKNTQDYPLSDITINKEIIDGYMDVEILDKEIGEVDTGVDSNIVWKIDTLESGQEVTLKFNMTIEIPNSEFKPKTGKVNAEYYANKALTGIQIDKFDAYSNNFVGMEVAQTEDDPDTLLIAETSESSIGTNPLLDVTSPGSKIVTVEIPGNPPKCKVILVSEKELTSS